MRYRPLGKTGLLVSEVTFGAHGVDNAALMQAALDAGINTFFTSGAYLDGREEQSLSIVLRSLGSRRDRIVVITGCEVGPEMTTEHVLRRIDNSLRRLCTSHIDVFCLFQVSAPSDLRFGALYEAIEAAKAAGKVGHLGMTGHHGGMQSCMRAAIDDGRFAALFVKYDFVSYPDQDAILRRATERGIGTIVFKTNAGNRQREIEDLEARGLSFRQATIKWALTNPDVSSVAVTITSFDRLEECAAAVATGISSAETAMLRRYAEAMKDRYCRFCGTCEPYCPHGVAVADIMRYAMYLSYYEREEEARHLYARLPARRSAAPCSHCPGPCKEGCPFGRNVRSELAAAHGSLTRAEA
jgi:aryl-alcohol dehydrogenase-like predicted oxidoreductase